MSQSERIFFILKTLDQKGGVSIRDLVQSFEVSERQAKRDIEYMRDRLGAPIVWRREAARYELSGPWRAHLPPENPGAGADSPFRAAFEASKVALAIRRRGDGRFLHVNPAFEDLSGRPACDLAGRSPAEAGLSGTPLASLLEGADPAQEGPLAFQAGARSYLCASASFDCPDEDCYLTLILDISDLPSIGRREEACPVSGDGEARGAKRILVVDDDPMVREVMGCVIESFGYEAATVSSGAEALALLGKDPWGWDLVILDIIMPGMDGFDLFNRIQVLRPGCPCLFISGFSPRPMDPYFSLPGVKGCLQKPIARSELREVLERALEGAAS